MATEQQEDIHPDTPESTTEPQVDHDQHEDQTRSPSSASGTTTPPLKNGASPVRESNASAPSTKPVKVEEVPVYEHQHIPLIPIFKRDEEKVIPLFHQQESKPPTTVSATANPMVHPVQQRVVAPPPIEEEYSIIGIPLSEQRRVFAEKTAKFEARIAADPWDTEAWTSLLLEAQTKDIRIARTIYERFLAQFPTAGRYWKQYAEQELFAKNHENVDRIFARSLLNCLSIDLWRSYVSYIRLTREHQPNGRADITKAFEFTLHHMGMDIVSTPIWQEYINFLKETKPTNQYEEGQKITALRKIYHRAIENPMTNLEAIWKDYDAFESELNKMLAKELINKTAPRYMGARAQFRERKRYYEGILRNMLARPPAAEKEKDGQQVSLWKRLLNYEKANPQRLEAEPLYRRVVYTYNQCLLCLYHYPEIWFDFANYELQCGHADAAKAVYDRAIDASPHCLLLYFAYADMLEQQKDIKGAKEVYEKLVTHNQTSLVYVQYMKFSRRAEGIKGARAIFKRGRTSPVVTHHLFVASALMEWQINKDIQVARNIFELGMTKFPTEPEYILEYIKFLSHLNEENNLRVLFEKAVTSIVPEKAKEIWNLYLQFEYNYGDLSTVSKIEVRKAKLYPETDTSPILSLVNRFRYLDLWPCSSSELDSFERQPEPKFESSKDEKDTEDVLQLGRSNPKLARFPRPDLSAMVPFRNEPVTPYGALPEIIAQLILGLPPAANWQGPIHDIEAVMSLTGERPLPPPPADVVPDLQPPVQQQQLSQQKKRKNVEDDDDEEEPAQQPLNAPPPTHDVFRRRQAIKMKGQKF